MDLTVRREREVDFTYLELLDAKIAPNQGGYSVDEGGLLVLGERCHGGECGDVMRSVWYRVIGERPALDVCLRLRKEKSLVMISLSEYISFSDNRKKIYIVRM